jgi:DNA helicase-2/ATP-dependent DNA helicase PcrA
MHSSKGLEFRVVFSYEVNEDVIPHIKSANTQQGIEEERRLFYVAMTRAKKELYIAYADSRNQSDYKPVKAYPSRFINEIPAAYTKKRFV